MMSKDAITYEQLIAFAAGELDAVEAGKVERYLENHPDAAHTVQLYTGLRALLTRETADMPGKRATARAQAILRAPSTRRNKKSAPEQGRISFSGFGTLRDTSVTLDLRAVRLSARRIPLWLHVQLSRSGAARLRVWLSGLAIPHVFSL